MLTRKSFEKMPKELMLKMAANAIGLDVANNPRWDPLENLTDAISLCERLGFAIDSGGDMVRVTDNKLGYHHEESALDHRGQNPALRLCAVRVAANRWHQEAMQNPSRPTLDLPWKWINGVYKYAAMDVFGDVYLYTEQPSIEFLFCCYHEKAGSWHGAEFGDMLEEHGIEIEKDGIDWMLSLTKRPE